jgi:FkbM family methyltransferase
MTYNTLSQDTEIKLINRLVPFLTNKAFVDIGAEKGVFAQTMLELGMNGVLFEPMPKHLPVLQKLVSRYEGAALFTCAVTDTDTTQLFNVATDTDGQELDYYHSLQKAEAPGVFSHSKSFEVECRSLQSLAERGEISSNLGVLKTDTEGNDLNVLRGVGDLRPEIVICEYFAQGLYSGWSEGAPELIIEHMDGLGYRTFLATKRIGDLEFIGISTALYHEKQWGNLFFFRDDFYEKVKSIIAEFILSNEDELVGKFNKINAELEEKEKVIQQLLLERQRLATQSIPLFQGWLARIFGSDQSN